MPDASNTWQQDQRNRSPMIASDDTPIPTKRCKQCGNEYPATTEYFWHGKSNRDGFVARCKTCLKEWHARHYADHRDEITKQHALYAVAHRAEAVNRAVKWQRANEYRAAANKVRSYTRNFDKIKVRAAKYNKANPQVAQACAERRRALKHGLPANFTTNDWKSCLAYFDDRCVYCGNPPGLFTGMRMSADHWIPITNPNCPGTVPTNIIPACRSCNAKKHNADPVKWLTRKFGKRRANQIIERVMTYFASLKKSEDKQ